MSSNLVMWSGLVAFVLPHVIALLQQPRFTNQTRVLLTAVVSVIGGGATAYFNGDLDQVRSVVTAILIVLAGSITFYTSFWKPTGIPQAIERATSPVKTNESGAVELRLNFLVGLAAIFVLVSYSLPLLR